MPGITPGMTFWGPYANAIRHGRAEDDLMLEKAEGAAAPDKVKVEFDNFERLSVFRRDGDRWLMSAHANFSALM